MNCEAYWELISAAVDGALTEDERVRLEAHLARCPECKRMYDQMMTMTDGLSGLETPAGGFVDSVMAAVAQTEQEIPFTALEANRDIHAQGKAQLRAWWKPIRGALALVACCLVVVGVWRFTGGFMMSSGNSTGASPEQNGMAMDAESVVSEPASSQAAEGKDTWASGGDDMAASTMEDSGVIDIDGARYLASGTVTDSLPEGFAPAGTLPDGRKYYAAEGVEDVYVAEESGWSLWIKE